MLVVGDGQTRTNNQINKLLCMIWSTFNNSNFVFQRVENVSIVEQLPLLFGEGMVTVTTFATHAASITK